MTTEAMWFVLGTINGAFWFWLGMQVELWRQRKLEKELPVYGDVTKDFMQPQEQEK